MPATTAAKTLLMWGSVATFPTALPTNWPPMNACWFEKRRGILDAQLSKRASPPARHDGYPVPGGFAQNVGLMVNLFPLTPEMTSSLFCAFVDQPTEHGPLLLAVIELIRGLLPQPGAANGPNESLRSFWREATDPQDGSREHVDMSVRACPHRHARTSISDFHRHGPSCASRRWNLDDLAGSAPSSFSRSVGPALARQAEHRLRACDSLVVPSLQRPNCCAPRRTRRIGAAVKLSANSAANSRLAPAVEAAARTARPRACAGAGARPVASSDRERGIVPAVAAAHRYLDPQRARSHAELERVPARGSPSIATGRGSRHLADLRATPPAAPRPAASGRVEVDRPRTGARGPRRPSTTWKARQRVAAASNADGACPALPGPPLPSAISTYLQRRRSAARRAGDRRQVRQQDHRHPAVGMSSAAR